MPQYSEQDLTSEPETTIRGFNWEGECETHIRLRVVPPSHMTIDPQDFSGVDIREDVSESSVMTRNTEPAAHPAGESE